MNVSKQLWPSRLTVLVYAYFSTCPRPCDTWCICHWIYLCLTNPYPESCGWTTHCLGVSIGVSDDIDIEQTTLWSLHHHAEVVFVYMDELVCHQSYLNRWCRNQTLTADALRMHLWSCNMKLHVALSQVRGDRVSATKSSSGTEGIFPCPTTRRRSHPRWCLTEH